MASGPAACLTISVRLAAEPWPVERLDRAQMTQLVTSDMERQAAHGRFVAVHDPTARPRGSRQGFEEGERRLTNGRIVSEKHVPGYALRAGRLRVPLLVE